MITGIIKGSIHSTINHPFYDGKKLLIVDKTDAAGQATGDYLIAIDVVDAGAGEHVLIVDEGNSSRLIFGSTTAPVRSTIVGIIDEIQVSS